MDLALPAPPAHFVSRARRAGAAAEAWAAKHLYCPRCESERLSTRPTNERVVDFECPECQLGVQLKAKSGKFGRKFANSAYAWKMKAIEERRFPDYSLLAYDDASWAVRDVSFVPGFFLTARAIERRNPLSATARRAGWVGSNVVLANLPPDARISVVAEGNVLSREAVREKYGRFEHLRRRDLGAATWLVDVLEHVRRLAPRVGDTFTLPGFYESAEPSLSRLHPENRHVRDKMRQQLQVLRDRGVLAFEGRGVYRILSA